MGIRIGGNGNGGRFAGAVQQIIEAERIPIKSIEVRKSREDAKLKLFQEFKGKFAGFEKNLTEFADFRKFRELKADIGDGSSLVSVNIDKERAQPGTYTLEVQQLASRSSILSNAFSNPDEKVLGIGYVNAETTKGESVEIFVDDDNSSLRGVANLINSERDLPIRASVIKDQSDPEKPWRLLVSAKSDGNSDNVTFPDLYFLDGEEDFYIDHSNSAQNALITLDGFELESASNEIPEFLQGITLNLKQARPDTPFTLRITEDHQKISGKVKELIDQVNNILDFINKQNQIDQNTDTRSTFAGDSSLRSIEFRLRNLLHEGFPVTDKNNEDGYRLVFLHDLGVEFTKTGALQFKDDKFNTNLEKDYSGIEQAITGPNGIAAQLRTVVTGYTKTPDGLLAIREKGIKDGIRRLDDDIQQKTKRLEEKQQQLVQKFSRLEASLSSMQQQQDYLKNALAAPSGGGGDILGQLMGS